MKTTRFNLLVTLMALAFTSVGRADSSLQLGSSRSGSTLTLTWTSPGAVLEFSPSPLGGWSGVTGALSPYVVPMTNPAGFFRLREAVGSPFDFRYAAPSFSTSIGNPAGGCACSAPDNPLAGTTPAKSQDTANGAVLLHTGELTQHATDLSIPGRGLDWSFERTYRSGMEYDGPLGYGWDFNYNRRLVVQPNGDVVRIDGLGRADRYMYSSGSYHAPSGYYTRLTRNSDGSFSERDRHGMVWNYLPPNGTGTAKLTTIVDRNGNQISFQYNTLGQLAAAIDTLGRSVGYAYDANGRLTQVIDFSGRIVQFGYDSHGDLVSATSPAVTGTPNGNDFPTGKMTRYTYSSGFADARFNHNLLMRTAPNEVANGGPPVLIAQYDTSPASSNADRLITVTLGGTNSSGTGAGGTLSLTYATLAIAGPTDFVTPVFQNTVVNRDGNRTEYRFNQLGNVVRMAQFTRGLRPGDPSSFTTTFAHNGDGNLIARTNPAQDAVEYVYDSANLDRLQQGNLMQVRRQPGPRGADQIELVTAYSYETIFNFPLTTTDARSNVTTYSYDSHGNRTRITHRIPSIVEDFEYNSFGQMTAHVLPDNGSGSRRRDTMSYYATGPQTGYLQNNVVNSGGFNLTTHYDYDAVGNVIRTVDARGNDSTNIVNALNQVVRQLSRTILTQNGPARYKVDTFYDANDNVALVETENRDINGNVVLSNPSFTTLYIYDILNNLLSTSQEVDPSHGVVTAYAYDADQNRTLTRFGEATAGRQSDNATQLTYDERDLVLREIRGPGGSAQATTQMDYDGDGNLIRSSQGIEDTLNPRVTTFTYDGFNRRISSSDAMGNVTATHYDANGNAVSAARSGELVDLPGSSGNTNLSATSYIFDPMDRLVQTDQAFFDALTHNNIGSGHAIILAAYNPNSQVVTNTDANGRTTITTYDTANRVLQVKDAKGNTTTYSYDGNNNVVGTAQVDKSDSGQPDETFTFTYAYDNLDRLIETVDSIGNTQFEGYDSRNNRVGHVDANDNLQLFDYDGLKRRTATHLYMTDNGLGSGTVTNIEALLQAWDDSSRLVSRIDNSGHLTRYVYDGLNRLAFTTNADGTVSSRTYDVHDNALTSVDPNGTAVAMAYDLLNRLISETVTPASGVMGSTLDFYQYDGLSRLVRATNNNSIVTRQYDSLSDLSRETQQVLPGATVGAITFSYDATGNQLSCLYPGGRAITRSYDALNRVSSISENSASIASFQYRGPARMENRALANGTTLQIDYDGLRRITHLQHIRTADSFTLDERLFNRDANGNKTTLRTTTAPMQNLIYQYDSLNRMFDSMDLIRFLDTSYAFDGAGNRVSVQGPTDPGSYSMSTTNPEPADFQMNQYTTTPFDSRQYDRNGNLTHTQNPIRIFAYDFHNQVVQFADLGSDSTAACKYDCFGRRIENTVNGAVVRYFYDGGQEIEEQDSSGATLATFVWGNGVDELLQMTRSGQSRYFLADDLGSIAKVTDAAGNILESYTYSDYGAPSFYNSSANPISQSAIGNIYLFAGRPFDPQTGWYNFRARYLEPRAGRFTSRDPLGPWGDPLNLGNPFTYVGNNPATYSDPTGLKSQYGSVTYLCGAQPNSYPGSSGQYGNVTWFGPAPWSPPSHSGQYGNLTFFGGVRPNSYPSHSGQYGGVTWFGPAPWSPPGHSGQYGNVTFFGGVRPNSYPSHSGQYGNVTFFGPAPWSPPGHSGQYGTVTFLGGLRPNSYPSHSGQYGNVTWFGPAPRSLPSHSGQYGTVTFFGGIQPSSFPGHSGQYGNVTFFCPGVNGPNPPGPGPGPFPPFPLPPPGPLPQTQLRCPDPFDPDCCLINGGCDE